jgi:L-amino acid N-acyltransferase YncA
VIIRTATIADAPALAAIYGHHALHGFGTFEEAAPSPDDMAARMKAVMDLGLPYMIAEIDGEVVGFAYAGPFRTRAAYRYTVEDSVYIAPGRQGQGVGKALLTAVIAACEPLGLRQMVAMIGDTENAGSVGVHRACGFVHTGTLTAVGYKAGRWVDVVIMRRPLNGGEATPPEPGGIDLLGH